MHDKCFELYLSEEIILQQIKELAVQINKDYAGKTPLFIGVLNGSFMFASDLFKQLNIETEISFVKLSSYEGTKSSGKIITSIGLDANIKNKDVIIIEDIIDSGKTLNHFVPQLINQQPSSLKIAALLYKPQASIYKIKIDYYGFTIPNKFVIGYGLDYNGLGRNFKDIYCEIEKENNVTN